MKTQVVIAGGGPGGCSDAMNLQRDGIQLVILEKTGFSRTEAIDLYAGRIRGAQAMPILDEFRGLLGRERVHGRDDGGSLTLMIGSRHHPERAPLWEEQAVI